MTARHRIVCGAVPSIAAHASSKRLRFVMEGRNANIRLEIDAISDRLVKCIPTRFLDLLEVASYVFAADQACTRGGAGVDNVGARWRRDFEFHIAVRDADFWKSDETCRALEETLGFLSDDNYSFAFYPLTGERVEPGYFQLDDAGLRPGVPDCVMLFSGGLDSLAGAVQESLVDKRRAVMVSHVSNPVYRLQQRRLIDGLRGRGAVPFHVPVELNTAYAQEDSQRTRAFLYVSLAAAVARGLNIDTVRFYENGVTSLNLPFSAQLIGARASRTTHPKALRGFTLLLGLVSGQKMSVENPFIWETKTDIVRRIDMGSCRELIEHAISCSHPRLRSNSKTHCGVCMQCIERRFAILAAGLDEADPESKYRVALLLGPRKEGKDRTMAESIVARAQRVATSSRESFVAAFPEVARALRAFVGRTEEIVDRIWDLYRRNAQDIMGVLSDGLKAHADEFVAKQIDRTCLLMLAGGFGEDASLRGRVSSAAKLATAVVAIAAPENQGVPVAELARRTKIPRSFFYENPAINRLRQEQKGRAFQFRAERSESPSRPSRNHGQSVQGDDAPDSDDS